MSNSWCALLSGYTTRKQNQKSNKLCWRHMLFKYNINREISWEWGSLTYCLINWTASSYFIPHSMRASATSTGALKEKSISKEDLEKQYTEPLKIHQIYLLIDSLSIFSLSIICRKTFACWIPNVKFVLVDSSASSTHIKK